MTTQRADRRGSARGKSGLRWWAAAAALLLLLWWLQPQYGLSPDSEGETLAPPLALPEQQQPSAPIEEPAVEVEPSEPTLTTLLSGRCLDAETRAPLVGFTVRLVDGAEHSVEAQTTGEGRFEISWLSDRSASIEVLALENRSPGLALRPLRDDELSAEIPILLLVPTLPRAFVRGRVVDERTRQGLASMRVQIGEGSAAESLLTDSAGNFCSSEEWPAGTVALEVFDDPPSGPGPQTGYSVEHSGREGQSDLELGFETGPTLTVEITGSVGNPDSAWRARILERRGDPGLSGRLLRTPAGWTLSNVDDAAQEEPWSWRPLRAGRLSWIRYARVEREPELDFVPYLELRGAEGELRGETELTSTIGVLEDPVTLAMRTVGWLRGEIRDAAGVPVEDARIWLTRGQRSSPLGPWRSGVTGSYRIPGLDVGDYEMTIVAPRHLERSRALEILPGENQLARVVMPSANATHYLNGKFVCSLGHAPTAVLLEIASSSGRDRRRKLLRRVGSGSSADRAGAATNGFAFANLSESTYTLQAISITGSHHWVPDELTVTMPTAALLFRCDGNSAGVNLSLLAVDEESGRRVSGQELYVGPVRLPPFTWPESRPAERWYTVPRNSSLPWTVWAPGYQPATEYLDDASGSARGHPRRIELERGFGMRLVLRVRTGNSSPSAGIEEGVGVLAGVEVIVDGESRGISDVAGELILRLERTPERIDLVHPRWRAVSLSQNDGGAEHLPVLRVEFEVR